MASIEAVGAREILDSRGDPTVEVEVALDDGTIARAAVPSGDSAAAHEPAELRDGDGRYAGRGVQKAVTAVLDDIAPALIGYEATEQRLLDQELADLDGTPDRSRLGANAILGVSLAVARAAADSAGLPLFRYVGGPAAHLLPVPLMTVLSGSGGVRELMVAPIGAPTFSDAVRWGAETYRELRGLLLQEGLPTGVGDEGGFTPDLPGVRAALDLAVAAIGKAGLAVGTDVALALDVAAGAPQEDGSYRLDEAFRSADEMVAYYEELVAAYPIVSLEDPLGGEDWAGWARLTAVLGGRVQLVGGGLFAGDPERLGRGIAEQCGTALLVTLGRVGSLTEALDLVALAHRSGFRCVLGHRTGDTEDTAIADLAVATDCGQIRTGAPARSERVAKYNQLLRIEEELDDAARYAGAGAFPRFSLRGTV